MKKLIIPLMLILVSCNCLPQISTQYLQANASCEAYLPNYLVYITVLNNCGDATLAQNPVPGTILNVALPEIEVTLTATNSFGNTDIEKFDVFLSAIPEIIWDSIPSDTIPIAYNPNELDVTWDSYVTLRAHYGDTIKQDSTWKSLKYWYLY